MEQKLFLPIKPSQADAKGKNRKGREFFHRSFKPHQALESKVRMEKETKAVHLHQALSSRRKKEKIEKDEKKFSPNFQAFSSLLFMTDGNQLTEKGKNFTIIMKSIE